MSTHELKISFRPGRTDEVHQVEDINFWSSALPAIQERDYNHDGCSVRVQANWKPVIRKLKNRHKSFIALYAGELDSVSVFNRPTNIQCHVDIQGTNDLSNHFWYPNFFLEHYIYEIFTIMNLALPGACDFFNLSIFGYSFRSKKKLEKERLPLSAYNFEFAWEEHLRGNFPTLSELPLSDVVDWYARLDVGVRQRAVKPIEKALFSLMHICKTDGDISTVVWVFHALEALFSTRVGEGFTNLINRISIVLDLNSKQKSILKKSLRKLYNMRSSLIHGGYEIYHPMRREVIDRSINDQYDEIYSNLQFGISTIIACLQAFISNGWYGIDVQEVSRGRETP